MPTAISCTYTNRYLSDLIDERHQRNVCVITAGLANRLFPYQTPIDSTIRIQDVYYQVVGLINETVELHQIIVKMKDTQSVIAAESQIKSLVRRFHKDNDFELIVPLQLLREAEATKRMFNIVLGSIAAISLLVGGIGIMNIMLATVTERTREIGVRRALGAKKKDIVQQFLIETVVLSIGGGLIGVIMGVLVPLLVSVSTDMVTIVTPWSVALAFGISGLTGIAFGIYRAWESLIEQRLGIVGEDLRSGDSRKSADWRVGITAFMKSRMLCRNAWLSERLGMGTEFSVRRYVSEMLNGDGRPIAEKR